MSNGLRPTDPLGAHRTAVQFGGLRFDGLTKSRVLSVDEELKVVATVNAEFIVRADQDPEFREFLDRCMLTFDGQVPLVLARWLNPSVRIDKLSGSDLIYDILQAAQAQSSRVFFLGGRPASNEATVRLARLEHKVDAYGYAPPYAEFPFPAEHNQQIIERIQAVRPVYVLVGFGARKQELWIRDNFAALKEAGVRFAIGTGGTFEFFSGQVKRAPRWVQSLGLEGLFRLLQEPSGVRLGRLIFSLRVFGVVARSVRGSHAP